jgi:hypothetical protein
VVDGRLVVISRDDLPATPDWVPEARDGEVRRWADLTLTEAIRLWDQDWARWDGDDG